MKKTIYVFSLLMILFVGLTQAITELPINSTTSVSGNSLDGSLAYDNDNGLYYVTGSNFPTGYIYEYNNSYTLKNSYVTDILYNYITVTSNNLYVIQTISAGTDNIYKLNKTGGTVSSVNVPFESDIVSITNDDNYIYVVGESSALVYAYDYNLAYVGQFDLGIQLPSLPSIYHNLAFDEDNNVFYFYNGNTETLNILDTSFNYLSKNEYSINLSTQFPNSGFRDMEVVNGLLGGSTLGANPLPRQIKLFSLPPTPPTPNYHTIYNPVDGKYYNYSKEYCVDTNTFCNNSQYVLNSNFVPQFYCSLNESQYCSDVCLTDYNSVTNTFFGVCSQLACDNECSVEGFTRCGTTRTYNICGNYDSDACLEYSNDLFCTTNQYCADTELGAQCVNKTFVQVGDTYTQDVIQVNIDVQTIVAGESEISSDAINTETVYTTDGQQIEITFKDHPVAFLASKAYDLFTVKTPQTTGQTTVKTTATNLVSYNSENYYAVDCSYSETYTVEDALNNNSITAWNTNNTLEEDNDYFYLVVNSTSKASRTLPESDNNKIIDTIVKPLTDGEYYISYNTSDGIISTLKITNNITSYNVIVEEVLYNKTLINNTGKSTFNDMEYISIEGRFNKEIKTITYYITVHRKPLTNTIHEDYYSLPIPYDTYDKQPNSIVYETNNTMNVYQVLERTNTDYPTYTYNADIKDMLKTCLLERGCSQIRAYANYDNIPTYHFSDLTEVCLKDLQGNDVTPEDPTVIESDDIFDAFFGVKLSDKFKLILATAISSIPFLLGIIVFMKTREPITIFGSVSISALFFFSFALAGYLPIWVLIVGILVAGGIGTALVKALTIGQG